MHRYQQGPVTSGQPVFQNTTGGPLQSSRQLGSLRHQSPVQDVMSNASFLQGTKASFSQRKQSYDVRSGRNNAFGGTTMGQGLMGAGHNTITSPRSVISGARQQIMNNTISGGLSVHGARKNGWDNQDTTARNGMMMRTTNLSVQDIVDSVLKKQAFGFEGYNPKPVVKDLLPVHAHVRAKAKRRMFCEEASKQKDKIPAPSKYQTQLDWAKSPETRTAKFFTNPRTMIASEIIKKSKNPAKTTPGPTAYEDYSGWKYAQKKPSGNYKNNEDRITFVAESSWKAEQSPGNKYNSIELTKFKETSPRRVLLKNDEGRFGPKAKGGGMTVEKNDKPGPSTYDAESSFKFANTFRGRNAFDKTKRVSFCETQAKLNISPGPAKHTHSIKMLDKLSLSPLAGSRKRL